MLRAALRLGAFLSTMTPCVSALAHGVPPEAYAVISHDAQGARAVRLSAGVAVRRAAQRFQFVCPSAWGDQYAAPLAALADGTIVVGATRGLMLLSEDGKVRVHPDPAAAGDSSDVVRSVHGVFSLRTTPEGSELLAVDAQRVRVLWKDTKSLYSLAALDDKLVLLRANGTLLEQVTVAAADGTELERQVAMVGSPVDYAFARANAGAAYALVVLRTTSVLGTLRMNTFTRIAEAELSIAGPLSAAQGTLLALDGKLAQLVDGQPKPLAEESNVLCLEQSDGLSYACHSDGITRVSDQTLGEPLFQFSWLATPDLEQLVAGESRDRCNTQWQDLRVDLLLLGTTLPDDAALAAGSADAGSALVDAQVAEVGIEPLEAGVADSGQVVAAGRPLRRESASCAALPRDGGLRAINGCEFALVLALVRRRRAGAHKIERNRADC